jgi:predicted nucleotidyltransferase
MSLVGLDHVFSAAKPVTFAENLTLRVLPPTVLMLLKIVAFMDRNHERKQDLDDIRDLLCEYEADSDRIFSEEFRDARIKEYSLANAFLLGRDLRTLCTGEEIEVVSRFIALVGDEDKPIWWDFVKAGHHPGEREDETAREQLETFSAAFSSD